MERRAPTSTNASTVESRTKGEKMGERFGQILNLLFQGVKIDKHALALRLDVGIRTIERDLQRLSPVVERNAEGQLQLSQSALGIVPVRHLGAYASLTGTEALFPDSSLQFILKQLDTPEADRPLKVQALGSEDLHGHRQLFEDLYAAIQAQHECSFTYKGKSRRTEPYRLLHKNGVWYLAALEGGVLKNFNVGLIDALKVDHTSRFVIDPVHTAYIDGQGDVWFTTTSTEVLLRVAPSAAHYFARRDLLPGQQHRDGGDGSLLVTCQINHPQQLLPVVRYWLPHVRIVRPVALHEALMASLEQARVQWEELP